MKSLNSNPINIVFPVAYTAFALFHPELHGKSGIIIEESKDQAAAASAYVKIKVHKHEHKHQRHVNTSFHLSNGKQSSLRDCSCLCVPVHCGCSIHPQAKGRQLHRKRRACLMLELQHCLRREDSLWRGSWSVLEGHLSRRCPW